MAKKFISYVRPEWNHAERMERRQRLIEAGCPSDLAMLAAPILKPLAKPDPKYGVVASMGWYIPKVDVVVDVRWTVKK